MILYERRHTVKARIIPAGEKINSFRLKVIIAVSVLILLLTGSAFAAENIIKTTVMCDGETKNVYSVSADPKTIISHTPFKLNEGDKLITDYFSSEDGGFIIIAKPHQVLIYDEDKLIKIVTVTGTAKDAIEKADIKLNDGDELSLGMYNVISSDMQLKIERAFKVKITVDGKTKSINTVSGTTEEILKKAGIILGVDDIVTPKLTKEITSGAKIKVQRVTYKEYKKTVTLEYETKLEYDDSKYYEEVTVKTKGKNGKATVYYRDKYIDGKKVKTEKIKTDVKVKPTTKVIVRGSKGSLYGGSVSSKVISELVPPYTIELDENDRPIKYKKKITGKATAYCTGTVTSTGRRAQPGVVAVNPRQIPYGTKMYIVSSDGNWVYGYAIAGDTGGFVNNSSTVVDLYMRSYNSCVQFGRRNVDIYILE